MTVLLHKKGDQTVGDQNLISTNPESRQASEINLVPTTIKILIEKSIEYNRSLVLRFVVFQKSFDIIEFHSVLFGDFKRVP